MQAMTAGTVIAYVTHDDRPNTSPPSGRHGVNKFARNAQLWVCSKKGKGSPYSITERRFPELIPVLGSQPAGDVSHKPGGRLPLLSARPAITPATLKSAAIDFTAW